MTRPTKSNQDILADHEAFQAAYQRAREAFERIDGVVGVAFGQKNTAGDFTDDIAIVVFVREKKDERELAPADRIPPSFEGYKTDVRVVSRGKAEGCDNTTAYDQIKGGIQIEVKTDTGVAHGTLGCLVKKRANRSRENVYLLTNKHVLYVDGAGSGDDVYHPTVKGGTALGPTGEAFYGNVPYPPGNPGSQGFFIDCAIARIDIDCTCCWSTCTKDHIEHQDSVIVDLQVNGVDTLSDVRSVIDDPTIVGQKVFKVGRTSGKTTGIVRAVNAPLDADPEPEHPSGPRTAATNTIEIQFDVASDPSGQNCKHLPNFTEPGDSGSIVVDASNRAIGLHTHGGHIVNGFKSSHACHILPVLDHLGICIPTTGGLSHGSSQALDGSGIEPRAMGDFELPSGQIVFTGAPLEGPPLGFPGTAAPVQLTDDRVRELRELLAEFRRTPRGPELHAAFADLRREMGYLVRNCRPVKVAWHRHKGPAFLTHVLNHLAGHTTSVPHDVQGITRRALLVRMRDTLSANGSKPLARALAQYGDELLAMLTDESCHSLADCVARLQQPEPA